MVTQEAQELDRSLPTKDGGILRTIRDACDCMTGILPVYYQCVIIGKQ